MLVFKIDKEMQELSKWFNELLNDDMSLSPVAHVITESICTNGTEQPVSPNEYSSVVIPAGEELGIVLRQSATDLAILDSFRRLRDGSMGVLEQRSKVTVGSRLISINGADLAPLTFKELKKVITFTKNVDRLFVFKLYEAKRRRQSEKRSNSAQAQLTHSIFVRGKAQGYSMEKKQSLESNDPSSLHMYQSIPSPKGVIQIACGLRHTILLTESGRLFSFGHGECGRLGLGDEYTREHPTLLKSLSHYQVSNVACGRDHSVAVTSEGKAFSWGWGEGGRLAVGYEAEMVLWPTAVEFHPNAPPNLFFARASCGREHTLLITTIGTLYIAGIQVVFKNGQMTNRVNLHPKYVPLADQYVVEARGGAAHSVILTTEGQVLTFGFGGSGALGHGDEETIDKPRVVQGIKDICQISCGDWHTVCVGKDGSLWTWGDNESGELGAGEVGMKVLSPQQVTYFEHADPNIVANSNVLVVDAACGPQSTAVVTADNAVSNSLGSEVLK